MMKRAALVILLFTFATVAHAQQTFTLALQESRSFQMMGASAAWAIDASIVEVSASNGTISLFARGAGTTKIVVVSITGQNTFDVVVQPRVGTAPATQKKASSGVAEARYSSAARETAHRLLTTTDLPIGQIAGMVGFAEQSALSRAARRWWGVSARDVRRDSGSDAEIG